MKKEILAKEKEQAIRITKHLAVHLDRMHVSLTSIERSVLHAQHGFFAHV